MGLSNQGGYINQISDKILFLKYYYLVYPKSYNVETENIQNLGIYRFQKL